VISGLGTLLTLKTGWRDSQCQKIAIAIKPTTYPPDRAPIKKMAARVRLGRRRINEEKRIGNRAISGKNLEALAGTISSRVLQVGQASLRQAGCMNL
jgi:hypothetical protein